MIKWVYHDGGREAAGYKGKTGDCVCRAVAIVTGLPYQQVYDDIIQMASRERLNKKKLMRSHPRTGVFKATTGRYFESLGLVWHPTMYIGQGCKVHLRANELPSGWLLVKVSKHVTVVIDGILYDTFDCSRNGTRCVYGYWTLDKGEHHGSK